MKSNLENQMEPSNFRVKLDLCKYYNDARRSCWIFVDGTKMLRIFDVMNHITKLFTIKEPFHLVLHDAVYLPPTEDIRILKENETVTVIPGSGLGSALNTTAIAENKNNIGTFQNGSISISHKQSQTTDDPQTAQQNDAIPENTLNNVLSRSQSDSSTVDVTFHSILEDNAESSATESKTTDNNTTTDLSMFNGTITVPKRKRVRRRRSKKKETSPTQNTTDDTNNMKKPKIINSLIISSNNHIRFDVDDDERTKASCSKNVSPSRELSNLLSLSQSSTPLTFTNGRIKAEIKTERISDEETAMNAPVTINKNNISNFGNLSENDILQYPIMKIKPQSKNVIAFKMLKIGTDYTPQVSEFIIAKVLSSCPKFLAYTIQIIRGISEVQVPLGKFTLIQDETEREVNDTITLMYDEFIEPRLLSNDSTYLNT